MPSLFLWRAARNLRDTFSLWIPLLLTWCSLNKVRYQWLTLLIFNWCVQSKSNSRRHSAVVNIGISLRLDILAQMDVKHVINAPEVIVNVHVLSYFLHPILLLARNFRISYDIYLSNILRHFRFGIYKFLCTPNNNKMNDSSFSGGSYRNKLTNVCAFVRERKEGGSRSYQ